MRVVVSLSIVSLAFFVGLLIVKPWLAHRGLSKQPSREELSRAISYDPQNPSYNYRLGLYWHYVPTERDHNRALNSYISAINLNPAKAEYWLELAKVYEGLNDLTSSKEALDRALILNPTYLKTRWMIANHWLRQGETDRALGELKLIIKDHPGEKEKVFNLLHFITGNDVGIILKRAVPGELEPMTEYLSFLMERGDTEGVKTLWKTFSKGFLVDSKAKIRYMDYLISKGEMEDAKREWIRYRGAGHEQTNLVWNGDFEEEILNGGFGWKIGRVEGVDVNVDNGVFFKGKRSLRIEFDGRQNVDFHHIFQIVLLEPQTRYTFSANMITDKITTSNGIFIQFHGINGCNFSRETEVLTGTNAWRESRIELSTPHNCNAGIVRLRRVKSEKLDNLIGGRAWIDGVRLEKFYTETSGRV
jgi:Tfp pilus assembly protein PilF